MNEVDIFYFGNSRSFENDVLEKLLEHVEDVSFNIHNSDLKTPLFKTLQILKNSQPSIIFLDFEFDSQKTIDFYFYLKGILNLNNTSIFAVINGASIDNNLYLFLSTQQISYLQKDDTDYSQLFRMLKFKSNYTDNRIYKSGKVNIGVKTNLKEVSQFNEISSDYISISSNHDYQIDSVVKLNFESPIIPFKAMSYRIVEKGKLGSGNFNFFYLIKPSIKAKLDKLDANIVTEDLKLKIPEEGLDTETLHELFMEDSGKVSLFTPEIPKSQKEFESFSKTHIFKVLYEEGKYFGPQNFHVLITGSNNEKSCEALIKLKEKNYKVSYKETIISNEPSLKFSPVIITFNYGELENEEQIEQLIQEISSFDNYFPYLIFFNCDEKDPLKVRDRLHYHQILILKSDINVDVVLKVTQLYIQKTKIKQDKNAKLKLEKSKKISPHLANTFSKVDFLTKYSIPEEAYFFCDYPIEIVAMSHEKLFITSKKELIVGNVYHIDRPAKMKIQITPSKVEEKMLEQYTAQIFNISKTELNILGKFLDLKQIAKKK